MKKYFILELPNKLIQIFTDEKETKEFVKNKSGLKVIEHDEKLDKQKKEETVKSFYEKNKNK